MQLLRMLTAVFAVPLVLTGGCAADPGPETASTESAQTASTDRFASDGPFTASLKVSTDDLGKVHHSLWVRYTQPVDMRLLPCALYPERQRAFIVFVVGPENARASVTRPMEISCVTSWGDNVSLQDWASFRLDEEDDQTLWDTLFPPREDGTRWYALQVAATNGYSWDSRYGDNYRLVFEPR